jgi:hypothetical protein
MPVKLPDTVTQRVAVVLGTGSSSQQLLNVLQPLLGKDTDIDLQGVFIEDDALQRAAALPFKELCRLTLSVREIHSDQFERTITLQTRTARRAIAGLAQRMGVSHTFRKVRGSTISLLRETAYSADITIFEPLRIFAASPIAPPAHISRPKQRIVVAVDDPATLDHLISDLLPAAPARILLSPGSEVQNLIAATRAARADMLVLGTSEKLLKPESLRLLMKQLRCPICLVRQWDSRI